MAVLVFAPLLNVIGLEVGFVNGIKIQNFAKNLIWESSVRVYSRVLSGVLIFGLVFSIAPKTTSLHASEISTPVKTAEQNLVTKIPKNMNLFVIETAKFRLDQQMIVALPPEVNYVLWPDSKIINDVKNYYLQTPPNDIMGAYALKNIVDDENDQYLKAFQASKGVFIGNLEPLMSANPLSELVFKQIAHKKKSLLMLPKTHDAEFDKMITSSGLEFYLLNSELISDAQPNAMAAQWDALKMRSETSKGVNVYLIADQSGIEVLNEIFN